MITQFILEILTHLIDITETRNYFSLSIPIESDPRWVSSEMAAYLCGIVVLRAALCRLLRRSLYFGTALVPNLHALMKHEIPCRDKEIGCST